ncbi:hypothetical protein B0J12DRAFT_659475 [Macrophomina phaseolina]|uniref:DUF6594 domain-containing protein n=1 Tax=Macrophomina phaseolina TaxID=35725 RepID=A0ABQ8GED7_9PEZI|nr:hypothetical protein B0J12DRAFT_659475 [Macrophomina phaseolina]
MCSSHNSFASPKANPPLRRQKQKRQNAMTTDFNDNNDLENQRGTSLTVMEGFGARPYPTVNIPSPPLTKPDTPRSRHFVFTHGSSLCRSYSTNIPPNTSGSSKTFAGSTDRRSWPSHKSASEAESGISLQQLIRHHASKAAEPTPQELRRQKAHRYMGYGAFSSLLSSDNDALVVRKFGALHARTILMLQDQIVQLEERLAAIDLDVQDQPGEEYVCHNGSFRGDRQWHEERYDILQQLVKLLDQYDSLVLKYAKVKQQPQAPKRSVRNIEEWLEKYPQAITSFETGFLSTEKRDDLIATAHREKTPLRRALGKLLGRFSDLQPWTLFRMKNRSKISEYAQKYGDEGVIVYDDDLVDKLVMGIILFLGLIMLLVPAWLLNQIPSHTVRLGIISGFISLFVGLLLLVTPSKPFETMVGTAAYGALLMVFMQIGN